MKEKSKIFIELEQIEEKILSKIRENLKRKIYNDDNVDVSLWLFYYQEIFDALVHWKLLSDYADDEKNVSGAYIPRGNGTIGYILDTMSSEFVDDTFDDPRGTVAIEDEKIGNLAWGGIPIPKEENSKFPISIISLFPRAKASWNKNIKEIDRLSKKIINNESEKLRLLTYVKILREQIQVLYDEIEFDSQNYEDNISKLLDKIRKLAYKTIKFDNILFVSTDTNRENYKIYTYKYLKHNYVQRRLKIINQLRWSSFTGNNHLVELDNYLKTITNSFDKFSIGLSNYTIIVYLNHSEQKFNNELENLFKPLETVFSEFNKIANQNFKNQKIIKDIITLIFRAYCRYSFADPSYTLEQLQSELSEIINFIYKTFSILINIEVLKLNGFTKELSNENVIAVGINEQCENHWRLVGDIFPELKSYPGDISVLFRLIVELDKKNSKNLLNFAKNFIEKYSLRNVFEIEQINKKLDNITLKINYNNNQKDLSFAKEDKFNYLLDVQLNVSGFEYFLYNNEKSISLNVNENDTNSINISSGKLKDFGLEGQYILLCKSENNRELILIGPREEKNEIEDYELLKEFAQKSYKKLILIETQKKLKESLLKTAIISILIDSYAHNISAHSLAALKWWIELRHKMLDKRIKVDANDFKISGLLPEINISGRKPKMKNGSIETDEKGNILFEDGDPIYKTTQKYYEALGLTDSTYNASYYSLFDFLQFADQKTVEQLFQFSKSVKQKDGGDFHPRFPVPIDYALYPFFRFLRDKGAFWSGVTRDMAFGGESKTWYKILWEDFANNPLYLGTIAKSEGITKINIYLAIKLDSGEWINGRFVTIDLSIIDYEEKMIKSPELEIQYSIDDYEKVKNYIEKAMDEKKQNICNQIFGQQNCNSELLEKIIRELGNTNNPYINRKDIKGRFNVNGIKIDKEKLLKTLDDIVKEIYLSNDIEKCDECVVEKNPTHSLKQECGNSITKQIEISHYSKYAFVKLGKCFGHFREILEKDDYEVFLPGGLVGEHALFTIFENTIRNIKHYKDSIDEIKKSGINFWIAIEKENLEGSKTDKELFKVQTWLMHETKLFDDKENKTLWQKVTDKTIEKILDENGAPKMGGNSQDKACAAMLFNNEFKSVENTGENTENKRDKDYFPWIRFTSANNDKKFDFDSCEPTNYKKTDEEEKKNFLKNYESSVKNKKGYLRKSLFMWRAADYFILKDIKQLEIENISRFKFVIVSYSNGNKELINAARDKGVIRLLSNFVGDIKDNKNDKLKSLYLTWLNSIWLKDSTIGVNLIKDGVKRSISITNKQLITRSKEKIEGGIDIYLSHGGGDELSSCNVRSHGAFWNKYFSKVESKQPEELENNNAIDKDNDYILLDLLEVVCTRIVIFDERINNRFIQLGETKRKEVFEKQLQLYISGEISPKENEEKSEFFKNGLDKLCNDPHLLIVHLSYIESLGYNEENINSFIDTEIKDHFNKDNFIFIITTGRGRGTWSSKIKDEYKAKTMFKPVESLLNAVESGISYNDNFDVKYNLIKVIFGS